MKINEIVENDLYCHSKGTGLNLGIKCRTSVVWAEIILRLLKIIYHILMLIFQVLAVLPMMFRQKCFDELSEILTSDINDKINPNGTINDTINSNIE